MIIFLARLFTVCEPILQFWIARYFGLLPNAPFKICAFRFVFVAARSISRRNGQGEKWAYVFVFVFVFAFVFVFGYSALLT